MLANEVLSFIEENDVKFIRLAFTDLFGQLRNIAILPDQLAAGDGKRRGHRRHRRPRMRRAPGGSLLLRPDPDTLCILPWRPQSGRVCRLLCDLLTPQGDPFSMDSRALLRTAARHAKEAGLEVRIGTDCEFYLLDLDDHGRPTLEPHDRGGYMDVAPMDRCEDIRRDIVLTLEQMNIRPESSHHERGPGQNEVDFHRAEPVTAADHYVAFLHAVRSVSQRYGVHATFLPRPLAGEEGNGLHVKLAFYQDGRNLFRLENGRLDPMAQAPWRACCAALRKSRCFSTLCPAAMTVWALRRIQPAVLVDGAGPQRAAHPLPQSRFARMQLSSPDPTMNPYHRLCAADRSRAGGHGGKRLPGALQRAARSGENACPPPWRKPWPWLRQRLCAPHPARRCAGMLLCARPIADGAPPQRRLRPEPWRQLLRY